MSSVKKNYFYQSLYQILVIILPFITAPYISRTLGSENVGVYSYTYTIAYYFAVFAMLGLEQYGNRLVAQSRDDQEALDKNFSELLFVHLVSALSFFAIYICYSFALVEKYRTLTIIQGMYVLSAVFDINWFFFGIEKFKITVTRNIIIKIGTVACIFVLVKDGNDLWKYCAIMSGSYLLNSLIIWKFLPKYVHIRKVNFRDCLYHFKPLLVLFVAVIAAHIYRMIDKAMLGWFNQMSDLGCYEYADKIIRIPLSLITALGTVMLSRMSNLYANKETKHAEKILDSSALFVIFMSFAMAFGLAGIAPEFVVIFLGDEYAESVVLVELLSITIPLVAWNNYVRTQMLIPLGKDRIYTKAVSLGAIVNVLTNTFLIFYLSARGAAVATIFSYIVVMAVQTIPMIKSTRITNYLKYVPVFLGIGGLMYVSVRFIGNLMGKSILGVVCEIFVGALVYCSLSLFYLYKTQKDMIKKYFCRLK